MGTFLKSFDKTLILPLTYINYYDNIAFRSD